MNQYNLIEETFVTPMLFSKSWSDLAITVGTTDLTAAAFNAERKLWPFYSGTKISPIKNFFVFNRQDRARLKSVRVRCNYADGLVLNSLSATTGPGGDPDTSYPWSNLVSNNIFLTNIWTMRIVEPEDVAYTAGRLSYTLASFEDYYNVDTFEAREPNDPSVLRPGFSPKINPDRGFYLLGSVQMLTGMAFSTKSIDPKHQDGVLNVWLEAVIQHSFPVTDEGSLS